MLCLYETSAGLAIFKVADGKLEDPDLHKHFDSAESATNLVKLKAIHRFSSTADAVEDITALQDGKLSKAVKKFLVDEVQGGEKKSKRAETLAVIDPKLGSTISQKLGIKVISDSTTMDLYRGIRSQLSALLNGVDQKDLDTMSLGLSHSLSRYKIRFSPDKVDVMVVQAIALLDDLDKELNIYAMRVKEWYGWHFPEMGKIITDNIAYAKVVKAMGFRTNCTSTDLSTILPEDLEAALGVASNLSMGTEISETDLAHIHSLCDQVISISAYRAELYEYLRNRMNAIAPNLTALVGELVGARLISHAGSLVTLAKYPASTVQILGAEKALFRALKTKHDTPKYGLIYHASLVGQAPQKLKGKMARMLATKTSLSTRLDALADAETKSDMSAPTIGLEQRAKLESRLRALERQAGIERVRTEAPAGAKKQGKFAYEGAGKMYNNGADDVATLIATQPLAGNGVKDDDEMEQDSDEEAGTAVEKAAEEIKADKKKAKKEAKKAAKEAVNGEGLTDKERRKAEKAAAKAAAKAAEIAPVGPESSPVKESKKDKKKRSRDEDGEEESAEAKRARKEAKRAEKKARKSETA